MSADITAEDVIKRVREAMGEQSKEIIESMEADRERIEKLEALVKELSDSGTEGEFKRKYVDMMYGLSGGGMKIPGHLETAEEILEWGRERAAIKYANVNGVKVPLITGDSVDNGVRAVRIMRAFMVARSYGHTDQFEGALSVARGWGDKALASDLERTRDLVRNLNGSDDVKRIDAQRTLGTTELGSGAGFVLPEYSQDFLDFLHSVAVVRSLGANVVGMNSNQLVTPYFDSAITVTWEGEGSGPNEGSPGEGQLRMTTKKAMAIIAMNNEFIRDSNYGIDALLRRHIANAFAEAEDIKFIRGDMSANTPPGLSYFVEGVTTNGDAHEFNRTLDGGVPTIQTITDDAVDCMSLLEEAKVPQIALGWVMQTKTKYGLMKKRDGNNNMIWPELMQGRFYGRPIGATPQIPRNLVGDGAGTGTNNKTEVYFAAFGNVVIGQRGGLEIVTENGAAYKDASGNVVSGFTNDQTVMRAIERVDMSELYRGKSITKIESVDWGE